MMISQNYTVFFLIMWITIVLWFAPPALVYYENINKMLHTSGKFRYSCLKSSNHTISTEPGDANLEKVCKENW